MSNGLSNIRVEYEYAATINIGNFQNVRPAYRLSADVPEGMHPTEARNRLRALVEGWLQEDVAAIRAEASE